MTAQECSLNEIVTITQFDVRKRDGRREVFDKERIILATERAFKAERDLAPEDPLTLEDQKAVASISEEVVQRLLSRAICGEALEIELVQDAVEVALMKKGA